LSAIAEIFPSRKRRRAHQCPVTVAAGIDCAFVWSDSVVYRTLSEAELAFPFRQAIQQAVQDGVIEPPDGVE